MAGSVTRLEAVRATALTPVAFVALSAAALIALVVHEIGRGLAADA